MIWGVIGVLILLVMVPSLFVWVLEALIFIGIVYTVLVWPPILVLLGIAGFFIWDEIKQLERN